MPGDLRREHELKTWPAPFSALLVGRKTFEIRRDDRGFREGDTLWLREWDPTTDPPRYTGREMRVRVTYIVHGGAWGLPDDLCVMAVARAASPAPESAVVPDGYECPYCHSVYHHTSLCRAPAPRPEETRCRHCGDGWVVQGLTAKVCMACNRIQSEPTMREAAASSQREDGGGARVPSSSEGGRSDG